MKKLLVSWFFVLPCLAFAHTGHAEYSSFWAGLFHPLSGLDHLLVLIALGIWLAHSQIRMKTSIILSFAVIFSLAIVLGTQFVGANFEVGIASTLVVVGGLLAFAWRGNDWIQSGIMVIVAAVHGFVHGTELTSSNSGLFFGLALLISSLAILLAGMGLGVLCRKFAAEYVTRILGGLLILFGVGLG
jgi:urease accessory protein